MNSRRIHRRRGSMRAAFRSVFGHSAQCGGNDVPLGLDVRRRALLAGTAIPVVGVAHVGLDPVQQSVHPVELHGAFHGLDDDMGLFPFGTDAELALTDPPQRLQRLRHVLGHVAPVGGREDVGVGHYHHRSGANSLEADRSMTRPAANSVSSSKGLPITCNPSGRPDASLPAGTAMPGRPAMFTVTVKMSLRYIFTGSAPPFSPMPKAADGVAGVRIALTPVAKQSSKSFLIRVRTFCARR